MFESKDVNRAENRGQTGLISCWLYGSSGLEALYSMDAMSVFTVVSSHSVKQPHILLYQLSSIFVRWFFF